MQNLSPHLSHSCLKTERTQNLYTLEPQCLKHSRDMDVCRHVSAGRVSVCDVCVCVSCDMIVLCVYFEDGEPTSERCNGESLARTGCLKGRVTRYVAAAALWLVVACRLLLGDAAAADHASWCHCCCAAAELSCAVFS